jgi:hypothetical protein
VGPDKQLLLWNGSETTFVSRQQLGKHFPSVTDTHATIDLLLDTAFSTRSVKRGKQASSVREDVKKRDSCKGAAVQRGLEPGSRGIAIFRSPYQETTNEDAAS